MGWRIVESRTAFENSLLLLREMALEAPPGQPSHYTYLERGPAVMVLPITHKGEIVLIRRFHFPVDKWCLELPAMSLPAGQEKPLHTMVARELEEDIGGCFDALEEISSFNPYPALTDECCHVFLTVGVSMRIPPPSVEGEESRTVRLPVGEVIRRVRCGEISNGPTAFALLLCEPRLRELGFI